VWVSEFVVVVGEGIVVVAEESRVRLKSQAIDDNRSLESIETATAFLGWVYRL